MNSRSKPRTQAALWGNAHGAGKGDKDRTNPEAYAKGIADVKLPGKVEGLERIGPGRYVKVYGQRETKPSDYAPKVIIH